MSSSEKFCLRWNEFESNISLAFRELREDKDFFDVTLACDDDQLQAHKVILSACSPFFRTVLRRNKHEHPLLYLKSVKFADLVSVVNFMYHGEVNVAQEELNSFLAVAEDLKVKGLTQSGSDSTPMSFPQDTSQQTRAHPDKLPSLPPLERPRSSPPIVPRLTPSTYQPNDDEIQEVVPVKSEPIPAEIHSEDQTYSVAGLEEDVMDTPTENTEEHEDYAGYQEDGGYGGTRQGYSQLGKPGSSGVVESLLYHKMTEGALKTVGEDCITGDVDILLEQHISRQLGSDRTDYVCLLCSKYCKSRDECANHIEVHHLKIVRACPYCAIELTSRGGLRQHISRKHREEHKHTKVKS
eukprot:GFUD01038814.1.p1 GENE.GFUD01038814.1~~GFUD01038814.1.p1  ORF type:complete len:353 (-),score=84.69 GFUD01038814.1:31-1089(-)